MTIYRNGLFALLACATLAACASHTAALRGMQLDPPRPAPNFTLPDQHGGQFSLAQTRGDAVALYFGFTHCKDVCPQTLALLGKARKLAKLSPAQMRIVMVSVDPARDSPASMRAFFKRAGVQAIGLTGSPHALRSVYRDYGIFVQAQKGDIVHNDLIFIIDAQGRMRETLAPQAAVKDVAADMRAVVN